MKIAKLDVSKLSTAPYNPRWIKPQMLLALKDSISRYGLVEPLVVNSRNMQVIGGNQRLLALREANVHEVECVLVELSDQEEKALSIALNKISGEWDYMSLNKLLIDNGIGMVTGFTDDEIAIITGRNTIDRYITPMQQKQEQEQEQEHGHEQEQEQEQEHGHEQEQEQEGQKLPQNKIYVIHISFHDKDLANRFLKNIGNPIQKWATQVSIIGENLPK